jgi:hypothetical protein
MFICMTEAASPITNTPGASTTFRNGSTSAGSRGRFGAEHLESANPRALSPQHRGARILVQAPIMPTLGAVAMGA